MGLCIAATRFMKREGQLWIKIFPDKPITKNLLRYVWVKVKVQLSIGLPLLNPEELCLKLEEFLCQLQRGVTSCAQKLPVKTKFVVARDFEA
jgi:large subunit ribosomal protein L16